MGSRKSRKTWHSCLLCVFLASLTLLPVIVGEDEKTQGKISTSRESASESVLLPAAKSPSFKRPPGIGREGVDGTCPECGLVSDPVEQEILKSCPEAQPTILRGYYPVKGKDAGDYVKLPEAKTEEDCALHCCKNSTNCNIAVMVNSDCYLLVCKSPAECVPSRISSSDSTEKYNISMISVRVPKFLASAQQQGQPLSSGVDGDSSKSDSSLSPTTATSKDGTVSWTNISCEVGIGNTCKANQVCTQVHPKSRNGLCKCLPDFVLSSASGSIKEWTCVSTTNPAPPAPRVSSEEEGVTTTFVPPVPVVLPSPSPTPGVVTTPKPIRTLSVSVVSKNVTLPTNEVSLFAYAVPEAPVDTSYDYKWSLISHPTEDTALMEGQTTQQLHLMNLKPGTYIFEVTVKSGEANGSANATIDVFAEKRLNHAPLAVISPSDQTIHLPTKSAVLDASLSTDDTKIISYQWELQKGPVDYFFNPTKAVNSTTLQVENLTPGNYTFKLTVEDGEHTKNSTTANITVIKETDYPPTANAGKDIVIYLPQTEVTLNGNASTDDKKIIEWEWKATGDLNRAADMQDTHTPYLKLSHLQVGLYQFELKVTDEAGQSATSTVHVIVKPATGNPPKADAGQEQTIILPQNWVVLDAGRSSSDSSKILRYSWSQLKGPSNATITPDTVAEGGVASPKANVTGLTKGEYEFQVEVEDETKLTNRSSVKISVMQRINDPPKANAGGDLTVTLPCTLVKLNGSGSTDDVKIAEWLWTREPESLAAGVMLEPSDTTPVLQLTDLVAGKYVFRLTVRDEQGLADEDTVTLTVKDNVHKKDLIEIILDVRIYTLSTSDRDKIVQQMTLLLHDVKLVLSSMRSQIHTDNAVLILYGQNDKGEVLDGGELARQLRVRIRQDDGLLQFRIVSVDTVLCQDQCSGHGVCQDSPGGRECLCNAFWMENFLKRRYGSGERNCGKK